MGTSGRPRVALVHDWLTGMRGGENVLEAMASLFPEAPIYTLLHVPGSVSPALESHEIRTSFLQKAPGIRRHYRNYLPLFPQAIESLDLNGFDLILSTSHCVAKGVIPPPGALHLSYCHTPMRYAWDQEAIYFPKRTGLVARLRGAALSRLRTWDVASSPRVDHFLANSRFVAERIRRYYGRTAEVLHPPVDTDYYRTADDGAPNEVEAGGYCLMVAALAPYKKGEMAIEACRRLGLPLKLVGTGPQWHTLQGLAGPGIELLGRVEADTLRSLYRGALCLLQPGVEDFGIAPVEALACGTPVVAHGRGGVLDIVEDGVDGALYEEGDQVDALAQAIDRARQIRFNALNLRRTAEQFSKSRFLDRLRRILDDRLVPSGGSTP